MRPRPLLIVLIATASVTLAAQAGDLVRGVRNKLSAGDLASGIAAVEDYRRATGVDPEYLDGVGWLARGAQMLDRPDLAAHYVAELRKEIPAEKKELIVPLGAAIEVESKLLLAREGRGEALRLLGQELARAKDPALRSRISKNINLITLEGMSAPPIDVSDFVGATAEPPAALKGRPVLLFLWAQWCGDCKAQAPSLARVWQKYRGRGLALIAVTRYYGSVGEKEASPTEEKKEVEKVWRESYAGLDGVAAVIDTEGMVRYGGSATPTFVLIDRKGVVRNFAPTRLSEADLARAIEAALAEPS